MKKYRSHSFQHTYTQMHHSTNPFSKSFAWSKEIFVENAVTETKW